MNPQTVQEAFVLEALGTDGQQEVQNLARAARSLGARAWFIARAGFTPEAREYARRESMLVSTRREIEALAGRMGQAGGLGN